MSTTTITIDPPDGYPLSAATLTAIRRLDTDGAVTLPDPATFTYDAGDDVWTIDADLPGGVEVYWEADVTYTGGGTADADGTITGTAVSQQLSLAADDSFDIVRGNAYRYSEGTALVITKSGDDVWPTTLDTVNFYAKPTAETIRRYPSAASLGISSAITCTVTQSAGDTQSFYIELTHAQTLTLTAYGSGGYTFWCDANVADYPVTLRSGALTVRPDPTA